MRILFLLITLFTLVGTPAALACERASLAEIEQEVTCPVCGTPLAVSESPQAERERAFIRDLIDKCKSKEEIKLALKKQYGEAVLAVPEDRGIGFMAYAIPIMATLIALIIVLLGIRRWRYMNPTEQTPAPTLEITESERERLEKELDEL